VFELHYTHNEIDYRVFPFDITEGIGWKNIQGFPCNSISLVSSVTIPSPGRYRVAYDETSVGIYNDLIEACTLAYPNRSIEQVDCYIETRTSSSVLITCENIPEIDFTYNNEVDNLEGNSNEEIIAGLGIALNEVPIFPNYFDIFYGGFYIEEEERYLIPLDFNSVMRGETGDTVAFTIKAVGTLTNCTMEIADKGASRGSLIWSMGVDDNWYPGNAQIDIGDFSNNDMLDIELKCLVSSGWAEDVTEGYLTLTADQGVTQIPLIVALISPEVVMDGEVVTDGELVFRCTVISSAFMSKLAEFGITEAS
jgi:hypothetical protein